MAARVSGVRPSLPIQSTMVFGEAPSPNRRALNTLGDGPVLNACGTKKQKQGWKRQEGMEASRDERMEEYWQKKIRGQGMLA